MFLLNTTSVPAILLKQSVTRFFSLVCPYMYLQIHEYRKDCIYLFLVLPVKHHVNLKPGRTCKGNFSHTEYNSKYSNLSTTMKMFVDTSTFWQDQGLMRNQS